ncbi:hypothetical protein SP36_8 [Salmonella phage 36]|uniref:Uncharacterized protein n=1 Tax=Salmonella phage 36 TaxID=1654889 RepID=A0A0N7CD92_9CAUD|nr:hypothetical protein SP36_8 [Salmonella phage 36]AKJ73980.1 hypothetical protein SP36_8 [Salmonella phage 36]
MIDATPKDNPPCAGFCCVCNLAIITPQQEDFIMAKKTEAPAAEV